VIDERFVVVGFVLEVLGTLGYLIDVIKGRARPNRVTWGLWALAPLIGFAAQVDEGVGWPSLMTLSIGLGPLLILAASFLSANAYWRLQRLDYTYGALAVIGLVLWQVTGEGLVAIVFAIVADAMAATPTVIKAYKYPETETSLIYGVTVINAAITLLTIKIWTFETYGFALYILMLATLLFGLVQFGWGRRMDPKMSRP